MKQQVIICVDDDNTVLKSLKAELQESVGNAYIIEIAEGGEEALELLEELLSDGYEVPLIISDHIMPEMKGDELLKKVHVLSPKTIKTLATRRLEFNSKRSSKQLSAKSTAASTKCPASANESGIGGFKPRAIATDCETPRQRKSLDAVFGSNAGGRGSAECRWQSLLYQ